LLFFAQFVLRRIKYVFKFERLLVPSRPEMLCEGRKEGKKDMKDNEKARS
jgi:hypothetical protein